MWRTESTSVRSAGAAAAAIVALACAMPSAAGEPTWRTYVNPRFGASAEVPRRGFVADRPPDNGDGQGWTSTADGGHIAVYGAYQVVAETFADYRRWVADAARSDGVDITYEASGAGWFVYSGLDGDRIVYERVLSACGGEIVVAVRFDYPAARQKAWDPIVRRTARSLAARPSDACP